MHTLRPWLSSIVIGAASTTAAATGLGAGGASAVLGQPLDFVVQVRLDAADEQALNCINAEVTVGDRRLPAPWVRATVEGRSPDAARIRVSTTVSIDEPVVTIGLSAGCASRVARRYVVLADPPALPPPVPAALPLAEAVAPAPASPSPPAMVGVPAPVQQPVVLAEREASPAAAPPGRAERSTAKRAERTSERKAERQRPAPRKAVAKAARRAAEAGPRLQLEALAPAPVPTPAASAERATVEEALVAVADAASATRAAQAAASAQAERLASMERVVEQLRTEARSNRELAAQLREKLQESDQTGHWTLPLLVLALMMGALAAWLAWRLSVVQRVRQQDWQAAAVAPPDPAAGQGADPAGPGQPQLTAPAPFVTSTQVMPAPMTPRPRPRPGPAWPPPAPAENWAPVSTQAPPLATVQMPPRAKPLPPPDEPELLTQRTEVLAPVAQDSTLRDVSIEELIDLEQQAEFFVVLGQDGAAVDLLNEHLRSSGGISPLPYLKLLEIHHRRGERKAYEAIRTRFNQQFNAYAPEWGADPAHGRTLADYSGVLPRLQQVWPRPLDAMAELEALLFRKSRGDLFELPAYREVLFLYALARDLMDREAATTGEVDLLLPMSDGGEFGSTAPTPFLGLEPRHGREEADPHPTLPLDFDLTAADRPASLFAPLSDPLTEPPLRR
ncbi:conserved exported hypothetical protein [Rubrivivax sp. A210]|uniref:hypothetical protein n=1 Tax=Rubrivivax sp. A210 TaxID=2772301 RepID=UPI00191AA9E1|nr:hypothetical protein [Rubrivivax sp. A210]CAD5373742.1 conserved exported hypothetical protein [Rubrivivax sp. A210]